MASIHVRIDRVVHRTKDYHVLALDVLRSQPSIREKNTKAAGQICGLLQLNPGITLRLQGEWTDHAKFGRQFSIHGWTPWASTSIEAFRFLHECVEGFTDPRAVRVLTEAYGKDVFEALSDKRDEVLNLFPLDGDTMSGLPRRAIAESMLLQWDRLRTIYELLGLLQDHGLDARLVQAVLSRFGDDARNILRKNPYRLMEIRGVSLAQTDRVAARMGVPPEDPRRIQGAVLGALRQATQDGHLFLRGRDFPPQFDRITEENKVRGLDSTSESLVHAIRGLKSEGAVVVDSKAGVYLPEHYAVERGAAVRLAEFLSPVAIDLDALSFLREYQKSNRIDLSDAQKEAVERILTSRVLVLTGLPGTGKTACLRAIVNLFDAAKITYRLMAPTGIATKRVASATSRESATVHRTFGYDGEKWQYHSACKLGVNAVIIDEMSMVDQDLFFRVLDALDPETILLLVGDDAQLPSVGPGNVLRELLASPDVPHVRLTQIFRQSGEGGIVLNSHKINAGQDPVLNQEDDEFKFVEVQDESKILSLIVEMAAKLKGRDENFQVIAPKYDGAVGIDKLNEALRDRLNPSRGQPEWITKTLSLREGDRVMVVQNDYKLGVYNGDMGKVTAFTKDHVIVKIHGLNPSDMDVVVELPKGEALQKLRLAYAVSVHRSQGNEFHTVIMPITRTQGRMLQRNLLYTAVTRAKTKVWLVGHRDAVSRAVANDRVIMRNSAFGKSITEALAGVKAKSDGQGVRPDTEAVSEPPTSSDAGAEVQA